MATVEFGYALSSEEHWPRALVEYAQRAEAAGFDFALISDHYHPWLDVQGQSCNVWPVLGAIAGARTALKGMFKAELPLPAHFEEATSTVREEDVAEKVACGPDVEKHVGALRKYIDTGYDHVYVHQIGYDQDGFFEFYEREVLPALRAA